MVVGWTIILAGVLTARHGKGLLRRELGGKALWFQAHRALQLLGLACALSGFVVIFV